MIAGYESRQSNGTGERSARPASDVFDSSTAFSEAWPVSKYDKRGLDWDQCVVLPRAEWLRSRGPSRSTRRTVGVLVAIVGLTLVAACASAVRSVPDDTKMAALATTSPDRRDATATPFPKWRPLRTALAVAPTHVRAETETAPLSIPVQSVPSAVDEPTEAGESRVDKQPRDPSPFLRHLGADHAPAKTELVAFEAAPFPYDGQQPKGGPFLDVVQDGQRGHRTRRGRILWESTTFNDRRVLVHIPAGFDPNRPAVLVVFYHGFGATLSRDVLARQQVPAQISASGANAILLAPQFAVDARDASAGRFWEPGGFSRFLREAARHVAQMEGDSSLQRRFAKMPVVLVAYSGGFVAAASSLKDVSPGRVRGVLLLDAAYGELDRFADFAAANRSSFLVSAFTRFTQRQNGELERMLAARGVNPSSQMSGTLSRGDAIFLGTGADASHEDYVTQAWTGDPIKDVLSRLPEFRLHDPQTIAAVDRGIVLSQGDGATASQ